MLNLRLTICNADSIARFLFPTAAVQREPLRFQLRQLLLATTWVALIAAIVGQLGPARSGVLVAAVCVAVVVTRSTLRKAIFICGGDSLAPSRAACAANQVVCSCLTSLCFAWVVCTQIACGFGEKLEVPEGGWLITLAGATLCSFGPLGLAQIGVVFVAGVMWLVACLLTPLAERLAAPQQSKATPPAVAGLLALVTCSTQCFAIITVPPWVLGFVPTGYWLVQIAAVPLGVFGAFVARETLVRREQRYGLHPTPEQAAESWQDAIAMR